jgi:hypothetical protein
MNPDETEEKLWEALRDSPLPDEGFSNRVLAALPPSRPPVLRHRAMLVLAWTVSACGIVAALCLASTADGVSVLLARTGNAAALLAAEPWVGFAVMVAFLSYVGGLYAARVATGSRNRSR